MTQSAQTKQFGLVTPADSIAEIVSFSLVNCFGKDIYIYRYPDLQTVERSRTSVELVIVDVDAKACDVERLHALIEMSEPIQNHVRRWLLLTRSKQVFPNLNALNTDILCIEHSKLREQLTSYFLGANREPL